jgi:hypothetical protein
MNTTARSNDTQPPSFALGWPLAILFGVALMWWLASRKGGPADAVQSVVQAMAPQSLVSPWSPLP